ncbi:MAG: solute symporter family protein [Hyphomicrobium sp.]
MATALRSRLINPRLGTYFSIFASLFLALVLLVMIFEQLGVSSSLLSAAMLIGPMLLYAAIGIASVNQEPLDYFAAGRRVPAFYSGLLLAVSAVGATGIVALTGTFFIIGYDALCVAIGGLAGFVLTAILMAPFLRKFGAFTLPSYLGRRFESRVVRIAAALFVAIPMLFLVAAELTMGATAASLLSGYPVPLMVVLLGATVLATLTAGGMRSQTWSGVAQSIAALLALLIPVGIVGVLMTNMPVPQLSHGPILRSIVRDEARIGLSIAVESGFAFGFPGEAATLIAKRFAAPFGAVSPLAFVTVILTTMIGFASAPWLLPRVAATPGVYETRKSLGWATVLFGLTMITLASIAVFMREYLLLVVKDPAQQLPAWLSQLVALDLATIDTQSPRLDFLSLAIKRDAVLAALPLASEMPPVVLYLSLAGAIAAALVAAGATTIALSNIVTEDLAFGLSWDPAATKPRLIVARVAIGVVVVVAGGFAIYSGIDPLRLWLWAMALTGATLFPVLVLSIWWKRLSAFGALAGLATGFFVTALAMVAGETGLFALDSALAGLFGVPAGLIAAVAVTAVTPGPGKHALELVRDIRVPGGEILYDREMRLQRQKKMQRG